MKNTELAHWRYRVKALESDLQDSRSHLRDARAAVNHVKSFGGDLNFDFKLMDEAVAYGVDLVIATQWLLEEARYKVELGTAQRLGK
jgi:hypothetical protein